MKTKHNDNLLKFNKSTLMELNEQHLKETNSGQEASITTLIEPIIDYITKFVH